MNHYYHTNTYPKMAGSYTIGEYQYTVSFENSNLIVKAINYSTLKDYICEIFADMIDEFKLIESLEMLFDMMSDAFNTYDENGNESLNITYNKIKDQIQIDFTIKFKYFDETFSFVLLKPDVIEDRDAISNKLDYYNKRLSDYDSQIAKVEQLERTVQLLAERLSNLTFQTLDTRQVLFYPGYLPIDVRTAIKIHITIRVFTVNDVQYSYKFARCGSVMFRPDETVDYKYKDYLHLLNKLIYLEEIVVTGMADLDMIKECKEVKKLSIIDCPDMTSINVVTNFDKMEEITIKTTQSITDLHVLEECKSLKSVNLSSTMNTGVFTKNIQFVVSVI